MHESLHDRFRAYKPYDRALALIVVVLATASGEATLTRRLLLGGGGVALFWLLDIAQRWVRVPTPLGQSIAVVNLNTLVVSLLVFHLHPDHNMAVPLYILNVAFATVAFGHRMGLVAAALSVLALGVVDLLTAMPFRPLTEWGLVAAVLVTLVAFVSRIADLQYGALKDGLTGLCNHRFFQTRLREELARTRRYGRPTGLAMLDIDDFKRVNDRFGHATGDAVLRRLAQILTGHCRETDVLCRYGGEELAVILPETELSEASRLAERLRQAVEAQLQQQYGVTVSIGVAIAADAHSDATELVAAADRTLYQAKARGKNQVCCAAPGPQNQRGSSAHRTLASGSPV